MTTFVLIPGAGGDAWYWHRVTPLLRAAGHEAIAVDLPAGDDKAGWQEYADCAVAAGARATAADGDLVVVGQSMGGFTAPLVAGGLPVSRLVLVNAMIPAPGETGGDWSSNTGSRAARRELDERAGRDPDAPFDPRATFFHDVPDDVTEEGMRRPRPQSDTPFAQPWPMDAWPDLPTRVLCGSDDRLFPVDFQDRVARERLGVTAERLPGGHLIALSRPGELVAALLR
jgi:pimeloyl-ACP methyl ester carboxylesterase